MSKKLVVYTMEGCPFCQDFKDMLQNEGIEFFDRDIDKFKEEYDIFSEISRIDAERNILKFSDEEKRIYATKGGSPHLDGNYTVFGEVVDGLDVIDRIAEVELVGNSRPKLDVRMKVSLQIVNN
jgi:peptidyl-prolyl cis-trans isomerase B (cyclophilin B)